MKGSIKIFSLIVFGLLVGCGKYKDTNCPKIVSIQMIDRNGFNETISSPDRVKMYESIDFLESQPYSKVTRLFQRKKGSNAKSVVTSYHENGQIFQYLEVENGRAHGVYKEWYPSGTLRIFAHVLEGIGDVNESCMSTWIFDKESFVYDENGNKTAKICYNKGELSGLSEYYYPNGHLKKTTPYIKNVVHGEETHFNEKSEKVGFFQYKEGLKHGLSLYLGSSECPKFTEEYDKGMLVTAKYYDYKDNLISVIQEGNGIQTVYNKGIISEQLEFKEGRQNGKVYLYDSLGRLENEFQMKNGLKHGEEFIYYPSENSKEKNLKMSLSWYEGKIQGRVKSWYKNGQLESEKDLNNNEKNGIAMAWYRDGSVMLIEEYEKDLLMKGTYMKPKEKKPVSTIEKGDGIATLYDADGYFVRRVEYAKGVPVEN